MEILLTVLVVEHLASPGKQRLDVFPNPSGPITDHTKPHLILWNQTRLFDLLEGIGSIRSFLRKTIAVTIAKPATTVTGCFLRSVFN